MAYSCPGTYSAMSHEEEEWLTAASEHDQLYVMSRRQMVNNLGWDDFNPFHPKRYYTVNNSPIILKSSLQDSASSQISEKNRTNLSSL